MTSEEVWNGLWKYLDPLDFPCQQCFRRQKEVDDVGLIPWLKQTKVVQYLLLGIKGDEK